MQKGTVVFLSYGEGPHVCETVYAAFSAWRLARSNDVDLLIYTDTPSVFADVPVPTRNITAEELVHWQPAGSYPRRCKQLVVRDALRRLQHPVALVDSDTWFRRPPHHMFDRIAPGRVALHLDEGLLINSNSDEKLGFAHGLRGRRFTMRAGTVEINDAAGMWNSGVTGIHPADGDLLDDAVELLDQLWDAYPEGKFLEQYALTRAVEGRAEVRGTNDIVYHYWIDRLRLPWRRQLPTLLEETRHLSAKPRAEVLFRYRPRTRGRDAVRYRAKQLWRGMGLQTRSVPSSAT